MRSKKLACSAILAAVAAIVAIPASAQADEWGPDVSQALYYTDNSALTFCYSPSFAGFESIGSHAIEIIDETTDIRNGLQQPPEQCEFAGTDVWWQAGDLVPAGTRGRTICRMPDDANDTCGSDDVYMDFAELDQGSLDWEDRMKTAVHELGHVVGLQHGTPDADGSAMILGAIPNGNVQYRRYSAHHRNEHINERY